MSSSDSGQDGELTMGTDSFKKGLLAIERRLYKIQKNSGCSSVFLEMRREIMTDLYTFLHSEQARRYFSVIYRRTGAENVSLAKELDDYLSEVWMAVYDHYDPYRGSLLAFITNRLQNRIIDDERKMGGIIGLPRKWEERSEICLTSMNQEEKPENEATFEKAENSLIDLISFRKYDSDLCFTREHVHLLLGVCFQTMALKVLNCTENLLLYDDSSGTRKEGERSRNSREKRKWTKHFYYRLFYSSDIISFLKESGDTTVFLHEGAAMDAMHFEYTNFCTDRRVQYLCQKEITPAAIVWKPLAKNCEVMPENRISSSDGERSISIPIQNEVVRGYLERVEKRQVSASNISQMKNKYMSEVAGLFQEILSH